MQGDEGEKGVKGYLETVLSSRQEKSSQASSLRRNMRRKEADKDHFQGSMNTFLSPRAVFIVIILSVGVTPYLPGQAGGHRRRG